MQLPLNRGEVQPICKHENELGAERITGRKRTRLRDRREFVTLGVSEDQISGDGHTDIDASQLLTFTLRHATSQCRPARWNNPFVPGHCVEKAILTSAVASSPGRKLPRSKHRTFGRRGHRGGKGSSQPPMSNAMVLAEGATKALETLCFREPQHGVSTHRPEKQANADTAQPMALADIGMLIASTAVDHDVCRD